MVLGIISPRMNDTIISSVPDMIMMKVKVSHAAVWFLKQKVNK